jgi:hypothetical protein
MSCVATTDFFNKIGQKQTFAVQNVMSTLPPIADICGAQADVRFVPIADNRPLEAEHEPRYPVILTAYAM